jgi:hypothetical protein
MSARIIPASLFLACSLCLLSSPAAIAKKMYRWVDEQGNTFISDQVPPDQVKHRRELLNPKGEVLDITEKAKTKEQLALEAQLDALKKAQEKIIAQQKAQDKVLLSTFRSLDDMERMLDGKMQSMDAQKNVTQSNLKSLHDQLAIQQRQAANHERNGEKIPQKLRDAIQSTEAQIQRTEVEIHRHTEKRDQVKTAFEADMARFKFLTQADDNEAHNLKTGTVQKDAANQLGLFVCDNDSQCEKVWPLAHAFINSHGTTPLSIDTDKLIMGAAPENDSDLSLSISKITTPEGNKQLFLDIRCRNSSLGNELCASQKALDIRSAFKPYIESALAND